MGARCINHTHGRGRRPAGGTQATSVTLRPILRARASAHFFVRARSCPPSPPPLHPPTHRNYQYKTGLTLRGALHALHTDGGLTRFYR